MLVCLWKNELVSGISWLMSFFSVEVWLLKISGVRNMIRLVLWMVCVIFCVVL